MQIKIAEGIFVDDTAFSVSTTHSGGPGGQHVNTSNTKVILDCPLGAIMGLTPFQQQRLLTNLSGRITAAGNIRVVSQKGRSQWRNRQDAAERLLLLIKTALIVPKKRRATHVPVGQKLIRLQGKKKRSAIKKMRKKRIDRDDD